MLRTGRDAIREVPADRFDLGALYDPEPGAGHATTRWAGLLEDIDQFDAGFFAIAPREADRMDPQQRLVLEVGWEALEDAGQVRESLAGARVGVFVGISTFDYSFLGPPGVAGVNGYTGTGNALSIAANRLSYFLDARGPSLAVDTACSSSLVAVHLACASLTSGETDLALAGGVNALLAPQLMVALSAAGMMAADGRCKTFDAAADGYVRGEGCGIVVLKRMEDAVRDGDEVVATVRGSAVNQDGRSNGLTAPTGPAQEAVIREALARAAVEPGDVGYVEAHGTGTPLGDPIEALALDAVLREGRPAGRRCLVGSVKTNFGHLEAAAGIAGLIKVALGLRERTVPPSLHFSTANPQIPFDEVCLDVPVRPSAWPEAEGPAVAGVSSFGFGGTNAHVVLGPAPAAMPARAVEDRAGLLLAISAHGARALRELAAAYADLLTEQDAPAVCAAAALRRTHHDHRMAVTGATGRELAGALRAAAGEDAGARVAVGVRHPNRRPRLAFVFAGQGGLTPRAGLGLARDEPVFRQTLEACDALVGRWADFSVLAELERDAQTTRLGDTAVAQPVIASLQLALAALWRSFGLVPAVVFGHSLGEIAAACEAGAITRADALRLAVARGRSMSPLSGRGAMLAAAQPPRDAEPLARRLGLELAAVNSPSSIVLSGAPDAIAAARAELARAEVRCRLLDSTIAFHSDALDPVVGPLRQALSWLAPERGHTPFVSTRHGGEVEGTALGADYWAEQARAPVRFATAVEAVLARGVRDVLELSTHPALVPPVFECVAASGRDVAVHASLRRGGAERASILRSLGALYVRGYAVDWAGVHPSGSPPLRLPRPPWQRRRHWLPERAAPPSSEATAAPPDGATRPRELAYELRWQPAPVTAAHRLRAPRALADAVERSAAATPSGQEALTGEVTALCSALAADALAELGPEPGARVADRQKLLLRRVGALGAGRPPAPGAAARAAELRARYPERAPQLELLERCGRGLPSVLRGERDALDLLVGVDSGALLARVYSDAPASRLANALSADAVSELLRGLPPGAGLDVLEIGGGTGGMTAALLERLPADHGRYVFTDLSSQFTAVAAERFPRPRFEARVLDIERSPSERGFGDERFDLVVAANVLHATRDVHESLEHVRSLLRPGGVLLALEQTIARPWLDLTFGLTAGWWRFADRDLRPDHPLLDDDTWLSALAAAGFEEPSAVASGAGGADEQTLLIARAAVRRRSWLILRDAGDVADRLAERLVEAGHQAAVAGEVDDRLGDAVVDLRPLDRVAGEPTVTALMDAIESSCRGALDAVQRLGHAETPSPLWIVTCGAVPAGARSRPLALAQAPLWGFGRALAAEHPELYGGLVDLEPGEPAAQAAALADTLLAEDEPQVAVRGGRRLVARLRRVQLPAVSAPLRVAGSYLVTGGSRGLGLRIATWLAERGADRLVLVSRGAPPAETMRTLAALGERGVEVVVAHADVTHGEEVERLIADCGRAGPPLRGVVHAAGSFDDSLLLKHDWARFERVLAPKVLGAWHLHRLTRELPLEHFVLVSSAASVVGMPGLSNYAAANAFLDALAEHRRTLGLPSLCVGFSAWSAIGMAGAVDDRQRRRWSVPASGPLRAEEALAALEALLSGDRAHVGVIAADWAEVAAKLGTTPAWLRELDSGSTAGAAAAEGPGARGAAEPLAGLSELPSEERRRRLVAHVRDVAASVLGLPRDDLLDPTRPLHEAGLDSLGALELRNRLQRATGLELAPTLAFDAPTIDALAAHLATGVAPPPAGATPAATGGRVERLIRELEQITDADAVLALGREEPG